MLCHYLADQNSGSSFWSPFLILEISLNSLAQKLLPRKKIAYFEPLCVFFCEFTDFSSKKVKNRKIFKKYLKYQKYLIFHQKWKII